jgi:TRAP-type C4-dicarboxylate transport system permease large subunit
MFGKIAVVMPLDLHLGIDPVWFGIFHNSMMELSPITPPVGINFYVVQDVRGRSEGTDVYSGILSLVSKMLFMAGLIIIWPQIMSVVLEMPN